MNRSRLSFLLISIVVMVPIVTGTLMARSESEGDDSLFKYLSVFQDVLRLVRQAYVEEISVEALMEGALDGTSDALDPFSTFIPAARVDGFREVLRIGPSRSGLVVAKDRGIVYVVAVAAGSPAAVAGVELGDIVTSIGGRPTRPTPLWRIQQLLAREPGTTMELELLRRGEPSTLDLELGQFVSAPLALSDQNDVAVLSLPTLDEGGLVALRGQLKQLAGAGRSRLLIDLRETLASDPEVAYEAGRLFARGDLGQLAQGDTVIESFSSDADPVWSGELVVLVGRGSVGASEVLASVLKEAAGATLVGQTSFGHAGRLSLIPLSTGAHMLLTDAFYTGPSLEPLHEGLTPDIEVNERSRRFAEKDLSVKDLTLQRGLAVFAGAAEDLSADVA
jgi:carboxyl-terminal processing protease